MRRFLDEKGEVVGALVVLFSMASVALGWPLSWPQATVMVFGALTIMKIQIEKFGPSGVETREDK